MSGSDTETSGVKVPPPLYFVAGFLASVGLEAAMPIDRPPLPITLLGAAIGIAGWLALDGAAMLSFIRARTSMIPMKPSSALVRTGPYRFTRNPMYVGMAALYLGLAFALGFIWPLIVLPLVLVAIDRLVIAKEEAYLARRFEQPYRDYMERVRRWL
ncbi:MAG: isoprenylcysteine carboxylmethyltransferase family protein [Actinomycetota bacterium]|nr:isoprenylcysteine carboxylmethyltransferase family protein [Actinomycetota bacterium]